MLGKDIEVVEPPLPEVVLPGWFSEQGQLVPGYFMFPLLEKFSSGLLLEHLHDRGGSALRGFSDQQMDVLRHHHKSLHGKTEPLAASFEDLQKYVAALRRAQERLAPIATASDVMQVLETVDPLESLGHGTNVCGIRLDACSLGFCSENRTV